MELYASVLTVSLHQYFKRTPVLRDRDFLRDLSHLLGKGNSTLVDVVIKLEIIFTVM